MKYITEEENNKVMETIKRIGWQNFRMTQINENTSNEPIVIKIKGSISDYAKRNGYVNAFEAMKIIEKNR